MSHPQINDPKHHAHHSRHSVWYSVLVCEFCETQFYPATARQKYCGNPDCAAMRRNNYAREYQRDRRGIGSYAPEHGIKNVVPAIEAHFRHVLVSEDREKINRMIKRMPAVDGVGPMGRLELIYALRMFLNRHAGAAG